MKKCYEAVKVEKSVTVKIITWAWKQYIKEDEKNFSLHTTFYVYRRPSITFTIFATVK